MLNLNETAKKIGRNISNLLIERDKTQQELAEAIGVSKSTVSTCTNGKRIPRMDKVDAMCKYFNVPRSAILGDAKIDEGQKFTITSEMFSAISQAVNKAMEEQGVRPQGQPDEYYDSEAVRVVTDRLRTNPEYSALFKAASNLKPEDVEFVTKFIEKMSD
jgi:transcriptional regulator with XRE-family HTH domain